jgi:hypothetical protein
MGAKVTFPRTIKPLPTFSTPAADRRRSLRVSRARSYLERRRLRIERQWIEKIELERDRVFALVERAAPYIDAVSLQGKQGWLPSTKLKLVYWTVRSGPNPDNSFAALNFIERMLRTARERHLEGLDPNPWLGAAE